MNTMKITKSKSHKTEANGQTKLLDQKINDERPKNRQRRIALNRHSPLRQQAFLLNLSQEAGTERREEHNDVWHPNKLQTHGNVGFQLPIRSWLNTE